MSMPQKSDEHKKAVRKRYEQHLKDTNQWHVLPSNNKKPKFKQIDKKQRLCLSCNKFFLSSWIGNRICKQCSHNINAHVFGKFTV